MTSDKKIPIGNQGPVPLERNAGQPPPGERPAPPSAPPPSDGGLTTKIFEALSDYRECGEGPIETIERMKADLAEVQEDYRVLLECEPHEDEVRWRMFKGEASDAEKLYARNKQLKAEVERLEEKVKHVTNRLLATDPHPEASICLDRLKAHVVCRLKYGHDMPHKGNGHNWEPTDEVDHCRCVKIDTPQPVTMHEHCDRIKELKAELKWYRNCYDEPCGVCMQSLYQCDMQGCRR